MKKITVSLLLLALGSLPGLAMAGKFYKWVDEEGVTHYTLTPPPEGTEGKPVHTFNSASSDQAGALQKLESQRQKAEQARQAAEQKKEQGNLTDKEQLQQDCEAHRKNLEAMRNSGRVRRQDSETGEYIYLTPEEKAAEEAKAQEALDLCEKLLAK